MPPVNIPRVILLLESSRESGRALLCGVARYAQLHGPWSFYWEARGLEKESPELRTLNADGIIMRDIDRVDEVRAAGIPAVIVEHRYGEISGAVNVVTDSEAIGQMGAEHLSGYGFRHYAFCGYKECSWSELRCESFTRAIEGKGLEVHKFDVQMAITGSPWKNQRELIAQWLAALPKPIGLMACNDDLAEAVTEACKLSGLSVPDDVAVIGVDNDEVVCGLSNPPMSSIAVGFERAGYEAARVLAGLMQRRRRVPPRIIVHATHVVPRRSTSILAVEDRVLAKALRLIRDRVQSNPTIADIARETGVSRRALEKRFREILGRSVLEEIRRVRTDEIARLLLETDLPVAEIANGLGFCDVQHVARYFSLAKSMSPLAYRKAYGRKPSGRYAARS